MFVSHRGQNNDSCGNLILPCRSVRYAVRKISKANDVIYIDYAEGIPYKECDNAKESDTIMLVKSLSFYGFNGKAILHCQQAYTFFGINSSEYATPRIVFSNLSLVSYGSALTNVYKSYSTFELELKFCDIQSSLFSVRASTWYCSIQILNCTIGSDLLADCNNLTARLDGSTFASGSVTLFSGKASTSCGLSQKTDIYIHNCTFNKSGVMIDSSNFEIVTFNVTISYSEFVNHSGLSLSAFIRQFKTVIVFDGLRFENCSYSDDQVDADDAVLDIKLTKRSKGNIFNVSISNSVFVKTSRALKFDIQEWQHDPRVLNDIVTSDLVTVFNVTIDDPHHGVFGEKGLIYLVNGLYHFVHCEFFYNATVNDPIEAHYPSFALICIESSVRVTFENFLFESYPIAENIPNNIILFYILSYETVNEYLLIKGSFKLLCPPGYKMNLASYAHESPSYIIYYDLFVASCQQCLANTYSLNRGAVYNNSGSNDIECKKCPVGGNCHSGQITSRKNFWGYESNQTVKFQQCPPKYCCDEDHCEHYDSCHGYRNGTLCGECPSGMSESLFNTKCKANKDCTSVGFWPALSTYLILYLLFFLYQEDVFNFVQTRVFSRIFSPSRSSRNSKPGGLIKIIFYYYQVVHLLRNSVGSDEKDQLLDNVENILSRALNFLIIDIFSFDCPFKDLRPVKKAILVNSVGYCLLVLVCLLYFSTFVFKVLQKLRTRCSHQTVTNIETIEHSPNTLNNIFEGRIFAAFANISLLMYNSMTQLCLSLLYCVPVGNTHILFLDGYIKCYQNFQIYLFGYMLSSILPFCLVPILGSYVLKLNLISEAQFCLACILPLPFCVYWSYLLLRWYVETNQNGRAIIDDDLTQDGNMSNENSLDSNALEDREVVSGNFSAEAEPRCSNSAVLRVLLGPFRQHKATFIFPSSQLPWEGFLILRRLALILVLTFVFDNLMKATLSTMLCVAILLTHVFVKPFKTTCDNVLETLSLGNLILISLFTLVKSIYYAGDDLAYSDLLDMVNVVENILIISPIVLITSLVILCILF